MNHFYFKESNGAIFLNLKVIPNASKDEIVGILNGEALKVKVTKAPESGKANKTIEKLLALFFELKKKDATIVSGKTAALKVIKLDGLTKNSFLSKMSKFLG